MNRRSFQLGVAALPLAFAATRGRAQIPGDKAIQLIVPFGPGGSGDITARMPAEFHYPQDDLFGEAVTTEPMKSRLEAFGLFAWRMSLAELAEFDRDSRGRWRQ